MVESSGLRMGEAVRGFLLFYRLSHAETTAEIYRTYLDGLAQFVGDAPVDQVASADLVRYFISLTDRGLSSSTVHSAWAAVRVFYRWASDELGVPRPDLTIPAPRVASPQVQPFSQDDVAALIGATDHKHGESVTAARDAALVLFLLDTGLRASELCRLTVDDLNQATGDVYVAPYGTGRKSKGRHVYIGKHTTRALWKYHAVRQPSPHLFTGEGGRHLTRDTLLHLLIRLGRRAGVPNCHPHRFRHTFAIQYLRNGGDIFTLQRLLGHSTLEMVRRYLALADTDTQAAHLRASPVDRWGL